MDYKIGGLIGHGVPSVQRVGVEIEVEDVEDGDYDELDPYWDIKEDDSLRNNGAEFITKPSTYPQIVEAGKIFYEAMRQYDWDGNARCGIHVHAEVNRLTVTELQALLTSYVLAEPLFFDAAGPEREENIYCVPWYRAPDDVRWALRAFARPHRMVNPLSETCKYSGLYLEPIRRFGTIEFRMSPVYETYDQLDRFIRMVFSLVNYSIGRCGAGIMHDYYATGALNTMRSSRA